jgi:HD-GYP domain-containing protein (c-di-GMP phosphodiesterase class II)
MIVGFKRSTSAHRSLRGLESQSSIINNGLDSLYQLQISVDDLRYGMYVSKLDRPWLDTPFLFQGFRIDREEVVEELKRYCKYVYVDVEQCDESVAQTLKAYGPKYFAKKSRAKPKPKRRPLAKPEEKAEAQEDDNERGLKVELGQARKAYVESKSVVKRLFVKLGAGETVEANVAIDTLAPMLDSITRNEDALSWLARMKQKQDYLYDHALACSVWAMIFGKHLGLPRSEILVLGMGALFMDAGKTKISSELLEKPGPLTDDEMAIVRRHVAFGANIVSKMAKVDPRAINTVRFHHERHDGSGYPLGLEGVHIPLHARIAGIVDSYDAMITRRPHAEPRSSYDAMRELGKLSGTAFPADLVDQFVQAVGAFPVGSLVELNTGEVGMVIAQNRQRRLKPKIMLLANRHKAMMNAFPIIDLRNESAGEGQGHTRWIATGLPPGAYGLDASQLFMRAAPERRAG